MKILIKLSSCVDPPEISVEKSWIHSGEGFEAQLVCIVHADPQPTVRTISPLNYELELEVVRMFVDGSPTLSLHTALLDSSLP